MARLWPRLDTGVVGEKKNENIKSFFKHGYVRVNLWCDYRRDVINNLKKQFRKTKKAICYGVNIEDIFDTPLKL